jgi:hypothetical protein
MTLPWRYILPKTLQYKRTSFGSGSFGTVHRGYDPNLCIKITNFPTLDSDFVSVRTDFQSPCMLDTTLSNPTAMGQSDCPISISISSKHLAVLWGIFQE